MGWLERRRKRAEMLDALVEERAIDKMSIWGQGGDIGTSEIHAGVEVTQSSALRSVAVYACVRLIAETVAALPAHVFTKRNGERVQVEPGPRWLTQPNPETTWFELVDRCLGSLNLDGNAFVLITARDRLGFPSELWTLNPREVEVRRGARGPFFVWGGSEELSRFGPSAPMGDVLHIKAFNDGGLRGLSPIAAGAQAIGLSLVTEKFGARFFGKGANLSGVIEMPASEPAKTREYVTITKDNWQKDHGGSDRSMLPGVLTGGARWRTISIAPEEAQFLETRKFQVTEIARLFKVPPHKIGDLERATFSNIEHQSIEFVQDSLTPWLVRLEDAFSQLTPRGQYVKWNVNGLLRGDTAARAAFYHEALLDGWMVRSEPRAFEDMPELDGLDRPMVPANMVLLDENGEPPEPAPVPAPLVPSTEPPAGGEENGGNP